LLVAGLLKIQLKTFLSLGGGSEISLTINSPHTTHKILGARRERKAKRVGVEKLFCGFISVVVHFSTFLSPFTFATSFTLVFLRG